MNPRRVLFLVPAIITAVVALWPVEAAAQRRGDRRGSPRVVVRAGVRYGYPIYSSPYFYDPFWFGFYDYQFRRYPPYPPYGYYDGSADLRVQVTPKQAEVYVDGYLVGTVDDFDGMLQRLHVPLGEHEITIYAQGYRSVTQRMLFRPFESYSIKDTMQPLAIGDAGDPRPTPSERQPEQSLPPRGGAPMGRPGGRVPDRMEIDRGGDRFGAVAVRVQPADADVLIDGERWETPGGERVLVQLSEGTHRIEVRKSGYRSYTSTIHVRSGETVTLNVSLSAGE